MSGLTRYVLRQTVTLTVAFTLIFSAAVWLVQSVRFIDLIVNRGLSITVFLEIAMLIFPRFVEVVLPIAMFLAILFSYNRLISESELVVMRAAGLSQARLARPALIMGGVGTALLLLLTTYLLPAANREFKDLQFEIRSHFTSALIQEGVFNTLTDHLTVYVRTRDRLGELGGIVVHDTRDPSRPITLFAERGALIDAADGERVLMLNGSRQQYDMQDGRLSVLSFERYTLELPTGNDTPGVRYREPDERYFHELLNPDQQSLRSFGPGLALELHVRLVTPLTALVFTLIPLACLLPGEFNRRGQGRRILAAIILAVLFEILDLGSKNLANRAISTVPLLYLVALVPIAVGGWLLLRRDGRWPWTQRPVAAAAS